MFNNGQSQSNNTNGLSVFLGNLRFGMSPAQLAATLSFLTAVPLGPADIQFHYFHQTGPDPKPRGSATLYVCSIEDQARLCSLNGKVYFSRDAALVGESVDALTMHMKSTSFHRDPFGPQRALVVELPRPKAPKCIGTARPVAATPPTPTLFFPMAAQSQPTAMTAPPQALRTQNVAPANYTADGGFTPLPVDLLLHINGDVAPTANLSGGRVATSQPNSNYPSPPHPLQNYYHQIQQQPSANHNTGGVVDAHPQQQLYVMIPLSALESLRAFSAHPPQGLGF